MFTLSLVSNRNLPIAACLVSSLHSPFCHPSLTVPKAIFIMGEFGV